MVLENRYASLYVTEKNQLRIQVIAFADTCRHLVLSDGHNRKLSKWSNVCLKVSEDTYICNTEEGYEKGGHNNEEGEQLSVLVEAFKLIEQTCDHRFHPTHLRQKTPKS